MNGAEICKYGTKMLNYVFNKLFSDFHSFYEFCQNILKLKDGLKLQNFVSYFEFP